VEVFLRVLYTPKTRTIDKLCFTITTSQPNSWAHWGIYLDTTSGYNTGIPDKLVYNCTQVDCTTVVNKIDTPPTPITVSGGYLYWLVWACNNGAVQVRRLLGTSHPIAILGMAAGGGAPQPAYAWSASYTVVSGVSLPSTFPVTGLGIITTTSYVPCIWVRYAT
jgi:hypothetical protein